MPVIEGPEVPAGARDITEDVVQMKSDLSDLFQDKDMAVIATAIGAVIGETLPTAEDVKNFLYMICGSAGDHFALCNPKEYVFNDCRTPPTHPCDARP